MEGKLNHISTSFEVDLYGNGVNDSELFELVNQFQSNFNISALKLSNIWNKHKKLSKGGLVVLSNFIFERKSISVFDLSFNNLDDQDFQVLYDRLIHLNKLYLGGNRISFSAMKILANPLQPLTNLSILDVSKNLLGDDGAIVISKFIYGNELLTKLYLSNNNITSLGISFISHSLMYNSSLICLDLQRNCIGNKGAMILLRSINSNKCGNKLTDDCVSLVIKHRKKAQLAIGIYDNQISQFKNQAYDIIANSLK